MDEYTLNYLQTPDKKEPLSLWLKSLDSIPRKRILQRLLRLEKGNLGDYKKIDDEISEIKFKFGSGYRIYFTKLDNIILLLINGGDKSSQTKDIKRAKELLQQWRLDND